MLPSSLKRSAVVSLALLLSACATTELQRIEAKRSEINRMTNAQVCDGYNRSERGEQAEWHDFYEVALAERFRNESAARQYCLDHAEQIVEREQKAQRVRWGTEGEENIRDHNSGYVKPGQY
ncbi:hypothetical protein EDC56_2346 [Sinobacterium caligoides]|uniref:Lipoprotein n=1 Tax=Sinobacterium caligoides TaxID=933926 RepID=A0A3N2DQ27_9GAMM|nr:hypothetical protein [Sinobacterium caligoides]ROS01897.1 hypothetical protein EDC56_2346 [Sinobacterium caligoides]